MYRKSTIFFKERHLLLKAGNFLKIHYFLQRTLYCNNTSKTENPRFSSKKERYLLLELAMCRKSTLLCIKKHFLSKAVNFQKIHNISALHKELHTHYKSKLHKIHSFPQKNIELHVQQSRKSNFLRERNLLLKAVSCKKTKNFFRERP